MVDKYFHDEQFEARYSFFWNTLLPRYLADQNTLSMNQWELIPTLRRLKTRVETPNL
jgi:hypothetical protein